MLVMIKKALFVLCLFSLVFTSLHLRGGRLGDHLGGVLLLYAQEEEMATEAGEVEGGEDEDVEEEEKYDFSSMTTYEMFWPVVAGKVPGDRFYQLKVWRDKVVGYLFFSKLKKSEYLKRLANKRLVEAEKLLEFQRESYFSTTIKESKEYLEKGVDLLFQSPVSESQLWLKSEYAKDLQKHLIVLERMKDEAGKGMKGIIEESIEAVKKLIEECELEKSENS